jgi:hypothetical protein
VPPNQRELIRRNFNVAYSSKSTIFIRHSREQ